MRIFDRLCGIVERHLPDLRPVLDQAQLFSLDITPHRLLRKSLTTMELTQVRDHFALPFPVTAIEDRAGCTILMDTAPGQRGIDRQRVFLDCLALDDPDAHEHCQDDLTAQDVQMFRSAACSFPTGACCLAMGAIRQAHWESRQCLVECDLTWFAMASEIEMLAPRIAAKCLPMNASMALVQQSAKNAQTAMEELLLMREPSRLFVESRSEHPPVLAPDRVLRSDRRAVFHSKTLDEVARLFDLGPYDGRDPVGWVGNAQTSIQDRCWRVRWGL